MTKTIVLVPTPTAAEIFRTACVDILRERLAQAEAGDIDSVVLIVKHADGTWSDDRSGVDGFPEAIGRLEITKQAWVRAYLDDVRQK